MTDSVYHTTHGVRVLVLYHLVEPSQAQGTYGPTLVLGMSNKTFFPRYPQLSHEIDPLRFWHDR